MTHIRWTSKDDQKPLDIIDTVVGLNAGDIVGITPYTKIYAARQKDLVVLVPVSQNRVFGLRQGHNCLIRFGSSLTSQKDDPIPTGACIIGLNAATGWAQAWVRMGESPRPFMPLEPALGGDRVVCSASTPGSDTVFFGYESGRILAVSLDLEPKSLQLALKKTRMAFGHLKAVNDMAPSREWSVVVTSSNDGTSIIWDTRQLRYVRTIGDSLSNSPHRLVRVSKTSGDIAIVNDESDLLLFNINGSPVAQRRGVEPPISAVAFSHMTEGLGVNVVATGHRNTGVLRLWSSWDLIPLRDVSTEHVNAGVISMAFSLDSRYLYASFDDGFLVIFERSSPKASSWRPPNYLDLSLVH